MGGHGARRHVPGVAGQGFQSVGFRLIPGAQCAVIGVVLQKGGEVQLSYIVVIAGEKAARRSGVSHAALLRPWGKGLIDPADLLRGERARLRRRGGCFLGGLAMGLTPYSLNLLALIQNIIPVTIIAVLIAIGLWFKPEAMMNGFDKFGAVVTAVITVCTVVAVFQYQTGIRFPLAEIMVAEDANGMSPLKESLITVGNIALVLIGAFPMVEWIKRTFRKPLMSFGKLLGVDETASAGFVANLANNIPVFNMVKDMTPKGKLLNISFAVCAAFVFGDHLGFTAGVNQDMILPVIVAKLTCGICALILANLLSDKLLGKAAKL